MQKKMLERRVTLKRRINTLFFFELVFARVREEKKHIKWYWRT